MHNKTNLMALILILFSITAAEAESFVSVGPTEMSMSDFNDLRNMVAGRYVETRNSAGRGRTEMVNVGPASMSAQDYTVLTALVSGSDVINAVVYEKRRPVLDMGIFVLNQSDFEMIKEKVGKGPLQKKLALDTPFDD